MEEARHLRLDLVRFLERAATATAAHAHAPAGPPAEVASQAAQAETEALEAASESALAERAWPRGSSWGPREAALVAAHADADAAVTHGHRCGCGCCCVFESLPRCTPLTS